MHAYIIWIAAFAYAAHVLEEYIFDWKNWAIHVLKMPVTWDAFAVSNGVVGMIGISCASVGWSAPAFALLLPALMLINATFMHVGQFLITKGRFSPGLFTSILLFFPIGIWAYWGAATDGILTVTNAILSVVFGAATLAFPIVMLNLRSLSYTKS
jgi:hypothetical protein